MFKKYNSIENSYRQEFLDKIEEQGFWDGEYVVQEKTHGANLSYWTIDGVNFHSGKRTGPILFDEQFYNYSEVLKNIKQKLTNIWNKLKLKDPALEQMTVFGELIGGSYPHKDVPKNSTAIKVQKGVFYCPDNQFYAFDIMINGEQYLSVNDINVLFEQEGLLYAKTLFRGSLDDGLMYSNCFDSTIPKELGLPEIKPNVCEGVVIRPVDTVFFGGGSRVIIKNKNEKWKESPVFRKKIKTEEPVSEKVLKLQDVIKSYATENRLNNVLSKLGQINREDFGKILSLFCKDTVEDFLKDYRQITDDLEKKELKQVTKSISKHAVALVKTKVFV